MRRCSIAANLNAKFFPLNLKVKTCRFRVIPSCLTSCLRRRQQWTYIHKLSWAKLMSHARGQPVAALGDTRKTKHDPYTKQFCCAAAFFIALNVWNVTNLLLSPAPQYSCRKKFCTGATRCDTYPRTPVSMLTSQTLCAAAGFQSFNCFALVTNFPYQC